MDKNIFEELVTKKLSEEINPIENLELNNYLTDKSYEDRYEWMKSQWKQAEKMPTVQFNKERGLRLLREKIENHSQNSTPIHKLKTKHIKIWYAAASIILLIATISVFENRIWQLLYDYKVAYNTYESPMGKRMQVMLPDSSIVFLQSNSKIQIPINFEDNRWVQLKGEAFFDVVKNEKKPFRIDTKHQITTVLGTSFNIDSKSDLPDQISVRTGKVNVMEKMSGQQMNIVPGQQIIVQYNKLELTPIFNEEAIFGWIEGKLVFKDASVNTIKTKIENWYGVNVELGNIDDSSIQLTGVYQDISLKDLLKLIGYSTTLEYEISDNKVYLSQKSK